jgi:hypothetical protein
MPLPSCLAAVTLAFALTPSPGWAQISRGTPWWLGASIETLRYSRALVDGGAPSSEAAGLRPSGGVGVGITLARAGRSWRAEVTAGWAGVRPQADNASAALIDKTSRLTRWRLTAAAERRLCAVGGGMLGLAAGPAVDWWRIAGESRARLGGHAAVALRIPLADWELENRLGVGVSGSPFVPEDAGTEFETRALVSLFLAMVVRAPL